MLLNVVVGLVFAVYDIIVDLFSEVFANMLKDNEGYVLNEVLLSPIVWVVAFGEFSDFLVEGDAEAVLHIVDDLSTMLIA